MSWRIITSALVAVLCVTSSVLLASAANDAQVGKILSQLQMKLSDLRSKALRLKLDYDKSAVIVGNMRKARGNVQVDPRQVVALRQELERMAYKAKELRNEMEAKSKQLGRYEAPLRRRYPAQAESFRLYFRQLRSMRHSTNRVCSNVAREAPRRSREVERMLRNGFGNYMAQSDMVTARATPTKTESMPTPTTSRAEEIRKRLQATKSTEEEELDRFFGESEKEAVSKMPPLMVDPADNSNVVASSAKPTMPPMMVIPSSSKQNTRRATTAPKPTQPSAPTKKPAPTKAPAATKAPASGDDDDDNDEFGGFDGFDDSAKKEPAKAAPKKEPKKEPAKKPDKSGDDEDFDSFMDFDDSSAPMLNREQDVAMAPGQRKKFKLFSERIADEFKRQGVVERTAAPPVVRYQKPKKQDRTRSFASRLQEEISRGLPDEEEKTPKTKDKKKRKRGLVEELMREIGRLK